jgi:hypothetical protein
VKIFFLTDQVLDRTSAVQVNNRIAGATDARIEINLFHRSDHNPFYQVTEIKQKVGMLQKEKPNLKKPKLKNERSISRVIAPKLSNGDASIFRACIRAYLPQINVEK